MIKMIKMEFTNDVRDIGFETYINMLGNFALDCDALNFNQYGKYIDVFTICGVIRSSRHIQPTTPNEYCWEIKLLGKNKKDQWISAICESVRKHFPTSSINVSENPAENLVVIEGTSKNIETKGLRVANAKLGEGIISINSHTIFNKIASKKNLGLTFVKVICPTDKTLQQEYLLDIQLFLQVYILMQSGLYIFIECDLEFLQQILNFSFLGYDIEPMFEYDEDKQCYVVRAKKGMPGLLK